MAKKKKLIPVVITAVISLSLTAVIFFYARRWHDGLNVHYESFGISVPRKYNIHGIDISRYQERINWKEVKSMEDDGRKIGFVFIKATEGNKLIDKYFKQNWKNAAEHRIPRGAYHYFHPSIDPLQQARQFIKQVKLNKGDLPPVLDVEETNGLAQTQLIAAIKIWLNTVEDAYGVRPIIYAGSHFYSKYLHGHFDDYPFWIAHYETGQPRAKRNWHFWQHSEKGNVNGIRGKVDFNVFYGDSLQFKSLLF